METTRGLVRHGGACRDEKAMDQGSEAVATHDDDEESEEEEEEEDVLVMVRKEREEVCER